MTHEEQFYGHTWTVTRDPWAEDWIAYCYELRATACGDSWAELCSYIEELTALVLDPN